MPKQNKNFPGSKDFPGSRRAPAHQEEPEAPSGRGGRRGRVRRGRFSGKDDRKGPVGGKLGDRYGARRGGPRNDRDDGMHEVADSEVRFADLLMQLARRTAPDLVQGNNHPEPLAQLPYEQELEFKNRALQEFWTARGLPDKPNKVLPSPRPRGYRTTTKRRVVFLKGHYELTYMTESSLKANPRASAESQVEPKEHKAIYAFILSKLNTPAYANLAGALNYLIIRGDYARFTVLFNVHRLNADVVRKAKMMGDHLKDLETKVISAFMFYDPSKSDFYFEARNPEGPWKIKKIFGPDDLHLKVLERTYAFHPTSFCQVNASILPLFLEKADQLLKPKPEYRLLDLYSGFGFFTLHLGPQYGEAFGVDLGQASIESAQKMAAADPAAHCRFKAGRIVVKTLDKLLPPATGDKPEVLLLDPPRQGTEPGVIRALAARNPARVLHIFCDLDTLPKEVNQWRKSGFMVSKVVPLDMFPGTDNLEVMVLFIPDRYGILNRIDKSRTETTNIGEDGAEDVTLDGEEGEESGFPFDEDEGGNKRKGGGNWPAQRKGPGGPRADREFVPGQFKSEKERSAHFAKNKSPYAGKGGTAGKGKPGFKARPDGNDKSGFGPRPDAGGKPGFRARPDAGGKPGFGPRNDRADKPAGRFGDKPGKPSRKYSADREARGDRPQRGVPSDRGSRPARGDRPLGGPKPFGTDRRQRGEAKPRGPRKAGGDRGDRPILPDLDVRPGKSGRVERRDRKPRGRKF